jgi:hypothetical protein
MVNAQPSSNTIFSDHTGTTLECGPARNNTEKNPIAAHSTKDVKNVAKLKTHFFI